jgi:prepilin-type N-terminal cleavage/methylation domain-containing protein
MHRQIQKGIDCVTKGFTLVETLVAVSILLVVIIGPMTIAAKGMQNGYFANEQTTAVFLAQEALESIKRSRDNQALDVLRDIKNGATPGATGDWYSDVRFGGCKNVNKCGYKPETDSYVACTPMSRCLITQNPAATGFEYGHDSSWDDTPFTRTINLNKYGDAWEVIVEVTWNSRILGNRNVVLQTWLYDQYK